jgi:hypothetical protein
MTPDARWPDPDQPDPDRSDLDADRPDAGSGPIGSHRAVRLLLGSYVLGLASDLDRLAVERHLEGCGRCRDEVASLAALPALLHQPGVFGSPRSSGGAGDPEEPALPERVVEAAAARVVRRRRARRAVVVAVAAAVVAAALGSAHLATGDRGGSSAAGPVVAGTGTGRTPLRRLKLTATTLAPGAPTGTVRLLWRAWGTELVLDVAHIPAGMGLSCIVVGPAGNVAAGGWQATSAGRAEVVMAVGLHPAAIRAVDVVTAGGTVLLRSS